jgi:hypothetical protein
MLTAIFFMVNGAGEWSLDEVLANGRKALRSERVVRARFLHRVSPAIKATAMPPYFSRLWFVLSAENSHFDTGRWFNYLSTWFS